MSGVQVFNNPEFGDICAVIIEDEPWWIGKEIAKALGYGNTRDALMSHVDKDDRRVVQKSEIATLDVPNRGLIIINESGLYSLILSSKLPSAKRFKRWVTSEVLPALRKTGKYEVRDSVPQRALTIDDYIRAASIIAGCRNERMPVVVALLEKGGLAVPTIAELADKTKYISEVEETGRTAMLINSAINDYGIKQAKIASLCGLHPTQIARIRTGACKPTIERARIIQDAIRNEISKHE